MHARLPIVAAVVSLIGAVVLGVTGCSSDQGSSTAPDGAGSPATCADAEITTNLTADEYWNDFKKMVDSGNQQSGPDQSEVTDAERLVIDATPAGGQGDFGRALCDMMIDFAGGSVDPYKMRTSILFQGYSVCFNDTNPDLPKSSVADDPMHTVIEAAHQYLCPT